jgi:hypothetical protein
MPVIHSTGPSGARAIEQLIGAPDVFEDRMGYRELNRMEIVDLIRRWQAGENWSAGVVAHRIAGSNTLSVPYGSMSGNRLAP